MRGKNIFWGLFFVLAAVLVVAGAFGSFLHVGVWTLIATVLLVAMIIKSIPQRAFAGILIPMAVLYMLYEKPLGLPHISIWVLLLAAILCSIGLGMIIRKRPPRRQDVGNFSASSGNTGHVDTISDANEDDNNPYGKVSFGSVTRYLHSTALRGGQFYASFGAIEVYCDQAQLAPEGAELFLDVSFGSIKLYVPRHWRVVDHMQKSVGGIDNDMRHVSLSGDSPTLVLTGNVSFGGVEIQYV